MKKNLPVVVTLLLWLSALIFSPSNLVKAQPSPPKKIPKKENRTDLIIPISQLPIKSLPRNGKLRFIEWRKSRLNRHRTGSSQVVKPLIRSRRKADSRPALQKLTGKNRFTLWRSTVLH